MITWEQKSDNSVYNARTDLTSIHETNYYPPAPSMKFPLDALRRSMRALVGLAIWPWSRHEAIDQPNEVEQVSLSKAFAKARRALGERMFAQGIDDGQSSAQIAQIDELLRNADGTGANIHSLQRYRDVLLQRLADNALADDAPLPGADAEYAAARKAQMMLARFECNGAAAGLYKS